MSKCILFSFFTVVYSPPKKFRRPSRPCPYCSQLKIRLTRHIKKVHKNVEEVSNAMKQCSSNQRVAFRTFRRKGMMKFNVSNAGRREARVQRERTFSGRPTRPGVVCGTCGGCFSKTYMHRHQRRCVRKGAEQMTIPIEILRSAQNVSDAFKSNILAKFSNDDIGYVCRTDATLTLIGQKLYDKLQAKQDKKGEVKKSVMMDMRRLAGLFIKFRKHLPADVDKETVELVDMFRRKNFHSFEMAVKEYTTRNGGTDIKSGLKMSVYYLIKKSAKILKAIFYIKEDDKTSEEIDKFVNVLSVNQNMLFGDAQYHINKARQIKLRRPEQLPPDSDVSKLRQYTVNRMKVIVEDKYRHWTTHDYGELRDLAVSRLTLFNARRGNEPSRLRVSDWKDALNGVWFDKSRLDKLSNVEQACFANTKLMYQTGKGNNHLVPVIVLADTGAALNLLADPEMRTNCGVLETNDYLFPSTQQSQCHVSGWHALRRICTAAGVPRRLITATKMRHRISTLYAALDVSESQRSVFYKHMGHTPGVNEHIYQAPPAESEIINVGAILQQFDRGILILCALHNQIVSYQQLKQVSILVFVLTLLDLI